MRTLPLLLIIPAALAAKPGNSNIKSINTPASQVQASTENALKPNTIAAINAAQTAVEISQIAAQYVYRSINKNNIEKNNANNEAKLINQLAEQLAAQTKNQKNQAIAGLIVKYSQELTKEINYFSKNNNSSSNATRIALKISEISAHTAQTLAYEIENDIIKQLSANALDNATFARNAFNEKNNEPDYNKADQIQELVVNTIKDNPQLIVDTIAKYSNNNQSDLISSLVKSNAKKIFLENNKMTLGSNNADVTIVEFNDYNCTYCKEMSNVLNQAIATDNYLKVIVKETPMMGPESNLAARAAVAAKRQGQYYRFRSIINNSKSNTSPEFIAKIASALKLDRSMYRSDIVNPELTRYLAKNVALANTLQIKTTPTLIISKNNGEVNEVINGAVSLSELKTIIARVRNR